MIEALISLRLDSGRDTALKARGDVLVVALPNSPWSDRERREFLLVEWQDPDLEAALIRQFAAGDPIPRIALPYAQYDAQGEIVARSTEKVNVEKLPQELRERVLDAQRSVAKVPIATLVAASAREQKGAR
jgi:hypothetical protein